MSSRDQEREGFSIPAQQKLLRQYAREHGVTIVAEFVDVEPPSRRVAAAVEDLRRTIHFVKENVVLTPNARSSEKFMHGIKMLVAKNYIDNLSEEVRKGLRAKAEQGHWPSVAPVGYVNNLATHRIEIDPARGPLIAALFEQYATGAYSLRGWCSTLK